MKIGKFDHFATRRLPFLSSQMRSFLCESFHLATCSVPELDETFHLSIVSDRRFSKTHDVYYVTYSHVHPEKVV